MSSDAITRALSALRDVAGVQGSFLLLPTGELLGKDLPAVFHDELFIEVGARLARFVETMTAEDDDFTSAVLRFDEHRLHVSRFARGLLGVIAANEINTAALRMALTLTMRRLEPEIAAVMASPPPAAPPSSLPPPSVALAGSQGVPRTYRGRVLTS